MKYIIDHEKYGVHAEFDSIEEALQTILACGPDFAGTVFTVRGQIILDETGEKVGSVADTAAAQ